jgi:hypothetical protein
MRHHVVLVAVVSAMTLATLPGQTGTPAPAMPPRALPAGIPGTGPMQRIVFNENWEELRREAFFVDLRQRIRNVRQGPDGLLYVLTDEDDGAILRIEP